MRPIHLALVILVTALWGVNFVAISYAVTGFPPIFANGLRFLIVLACLTPFLKREPGRMAALLTAAFTLGVVHFGLVFLGMARAGDLAPVIVAAQTNVPFATLLAVFFLGERIRLWRAAGIALSFVGVVLIGLAPDTFAHLDALLIILASALAYGVVANLMRGLQGISAFTVQAWVALMAMPVSLALSGLVESGQATALVRAPWWAWGGVVYSALASSILGHGGMTYLLQRYPVTVVTPYILLMPVFALLAAILIEGERLGPMDWAGAATTLAGIAIITLRNRKRALD